MIHGSLFSGIGGFDLAAQWMGWNNAFHCEWNEFCQKILKYYWPYAQTYQDISRRSKQSNRSEAVANSEYFGLHGAEVGSGNRKGNDRDTTRKDNAKQSKGCGSKAADPNSNGSRLQKHTQNELASVQGVNLVEHLQRMHGETSHLNPLFVEEMMGFPENWCDI